MQPPEVLIAATEFPVTNTLARGTTEIELGFSGFGNIAVSPDGTDRIFRDINAGLLGLATGSAALDAGSEDIDFLPLPRGAPDPAPLFDLDGGSRIAGERIDMGAHEGTD